MLRHRQREGGRASARRLCSAASAPAASRETEGEPAAGEAEAGRQRLQVGPGGGSDWEGVVELRELHHPVPLQPAGQRLLHHRGRPEQLSPEL